MKGVLFGSYHSFDDLNLILNSKEIGSPAVKERKIDIEGADGSLDLTDFFGEAKYEDVRHKFNFSTLVAPSEFLTFFSTVKNALHGKKMRIVLDDDPHFYYIGRLHVSNFTNEKNIGIISIEASCEPYKYKIQPSTVSVTVDGVSANLYDTSKISNLSAAITLGEDEFFEVDAVNNTTAYQYLTFFHNPLDAGEVAPNQNLTILLETKDFVVSGSTETRLYFTSVNVGQPDYFSPSTYSTRLVTHNRSTYALYPVATKDEATISSAVYFIRSFISLAPGSKCKGKFRLSILPGDVKAETFTYVSHDGAMRGLQLVNSRKRAVPTITATSPFTIYHGSNTYSIGAGTFTIPEIELTEGVNDIAVKGSGTITFTWQEGDL